MKLARIFAPDARKVAHALIIFAAVSLFLPIIPAYQTVVCVTTPCDPVPVGTTLLGLLENAGKTPSTAGYLERLGYAGLLAELVVAYAAVCAVTASKT